MVEDAGLAIGAAIDKSPLIENLTTQMVLYSNPEL